MKLSDLLEKGFAAFIFDCDGTLVDSIPAHLKAMQAAFSRHDLLLPATWFFQNHSIPTDTMLQKFEADGLGHIADPTLILADHKKFFMDNVDLVEEIPVVTTVVREWAGRVPIGVASNGHRANVEASLRALSLWSFFDTVVTREDVLHGKPNPDLYLETARRLNVAPQQCLIFEDSDTGIQGATAAGATVVDVREFHTPAWSHE
jgi:beta-phosphoglucomutase-like phosphatase (HAD superfamily)